MFLFSKASSPAPWSAQPRIHWMSEHLSPEVKLPGCEAGHSLSSSSFVKNVGAILPLPHMTSWHGA
jgi:hypothetical protein